MKCQYFHLLLLLLYILLLRAVSALSYHKDNFLIINDGADAKQLVIVDLEKRTFCREIQKGRANNELINLWDVVVFNDDLFLSSINERKIIKINRHIKIKEKE